MGRTEKPAGSIECDVIFLSYEYGLSTLSTPNRIELLVEKINNHSFPKVDKFKRKKGINITHSLSKMIYITPITH